MNTLFSLKYTLTACCAGFVLALDQATKIAIHTRMELYETIVIIPRFFNIYYTRNPGGAFGLFGASSESVRFILFLLFPVICVFIIFLMLRSAYNKLEVVALGFILGGAFGNYMDRLRFGSVIDFIDWYITVDSREWHWPTFNMADSFIVTGICLLLFCQILESLKIKKGTVLSELKPLS